MGVNPNTNKIEKLTEELAKISRFDNDGNLVPVDLLRPDGSVVPKHWTVLKHGELVDIKGYTFRIQYIGETSILLEPVKPTDAVISEASR